MSSTHARRMNRIALDLMVLALVAFGAFHFLAFEIHTYPGLQNRSIRGWEVWRAIFRIRVWDFSNVTGAIAVATFLAHSLIVVASPFLVSALRASRSLWWLAILSSGMAACGLAGLLVVNPFDPSFSIPGPGLYCLFASLALNFLGLLFIRRDSPPLSSPS